MRRLLATIIAGLNSLFWLFVEAFFVVMACVVIVRLLYIVWSLA